MMTGGGGGHKERVKVGSYQLLSWMMWYVCVGGELLWLEGQ